MGWGVSSPPQVPLVPTRLGVDSRLYILDPLHTYRYSWNWGIAAAERSFQIAWASTWSVSNTSLLPHSDAKFQGGKGIDRPKAEGAKQMICRAEFSDARFSQRRRNVEAVSIGRRTNTCGRAHVHKNSNVVVVCVLRPALFFFVK